MWRLADELMHYGMPRRSGRYPWGSGEDPYQHDGDFMSRVKQLRKQGMSEKDVANAVGCESTTELRAKYAIATNQHRADEVARVKSMLSDGYSQAEIARAMGKNESTIRSLMNEQSSVRTSQAQTVADFLKKQVAEKGMIDVGVGVERELGISREKLNQAIEMLKVEGYVDYGGGVPQATNPGKQTNVKVLCPPGTEHREIFDAFKSNGVQSIRDYRVREDENGKEFVTKSFVYPKSMDSSRLAIRYAEDGGIDRDGVIEIRRGLKDLNLGNDHYAQVRILVDGKRYLKGMAIYSDDLPDGVDVRFNTNKTKDIPKMEVLKKIKDDPDNPFGALIREEGGQSYYMDEKGQRQLNLINKTKIEGDWGEWSHELPSQFLSKQSMSLIHKQLGLAAKDKDEEFADICALTNPTVKKAMLETFANDCDSAAVHLKAAALPRQQYQVILPVSSLKDNEIYAPNYKDGETVALIRYPHGGTFEIPVLRVNKKNPEATRVIGPNAKDAVGINSAVAARLSGADFDGDTVMVIPCNSSGSRVRITSTPPLEGLKNFEPKVTYGYDKVTTDANGNEHYFRNGHEFKKMNNTQTEMGKVSNLITDMTLKGATPEELARAVRHSMVVIDAEKHKLDYKASEEENGIAALKKRYQGHTDEDGSYHESASTLISRSKGEKEVLKRKGSPRIDPETGKLIYKEVIETYIDKKGKERVRTQKSSQMAEVDDARKISSGTPQEEAYAEYANKMKALANAARKEMLMTGKIEYKASAATTYAEERNALLSKLNVALKNAPRERQAQLAANSVVTAKLRDNPYMTPKEKKKAAQQALTAARIKFNAKRTPIDISDREWEAIQAGAISENVLWKIINNTDIDKLRQRATPRAVTTVTDAKAAKIRAMRASGYTNSDIAQAVGLSTSTVSKYAT